MAVALRRISDFAHGSTSELALGLPGQKKRTSSGSVRRWPILRTRSSSERPDRRSEDRNLVSLIRDCQAFATFGATTCKHRASILGCHPLTETMTVLATAI